MTVFEVVSARQQVSYFFGLKAVRDLYLGAALSEALHRVDPDVLVDEIKRLVPKPSRTVLASHAVREERIFCLPCVLRTTPYLLGYYRLLYGLSQKQFYDQGPFGRFKRMEVRGQIDIRVDGFIDPLCVSLCATAAQLVDGVDELTHEIVHELQLMTLGAQLRGGANTQIGQEAAVHIKDLITDAVRPFVIEESAVAVQIANSSGRTVIIQVSNDPDISITEVLQTGVRPLVAIEVKGGTDLSNIHNRVGEAEKSHQKARASGFLECWTIINVRSDAVSMDTLKRESPTTSRFFHLSRLRDKSSTEYHEFIDLLTSVTSVPLTHATEQAARPI